jgi:hypothetical protein
MENLASVLSKCAFCALLVFFTHSRFITKQGHCAGTDKQNKKRGKNLNGFCSATTSHSTYSSWIQTGRLQSGLPPLDEKRSPWSAFCMLSSHTLPPPTPHSYPHLHPACKAGKGGQVGKGVVGREGRVWVRLLG